MASSELEKYTDEQLRDELRFREEGGGQKQKALGGPAKAVSVPGRDPALAEAGDAELIEALREKQRIVYGVDDRQDYYEITEAAVSNQAEAVAALFDAGDLEDLGDGTARLKVQSFKEAYRLCDSERYKAQPCGAFCTGFLVGPDLIATAGHCVSPNYLSNNVERIRFVFGYRMQGPAQANLVIPLTNIYSGKEVVKHRLTQSGTDWALVRLDRPATGRPILRIRRSGKIANLSSVYVMGHPCGLPLKYAPGARVRDNAPAAFFSANLDTYGGNSGSPVFNASHEVEGILVRGGTDFMQKGNCFVSAVVPDTGGRGEDVTRTTEFQHLVPESED
jgi:hypothetical protein